MPLVMTRPTQSGPTSVPGYSTTSIVPSNATSIVDTSYDTTTKWIVTIRNMLHSRVQAFEVLALRRGNGSPTHSQYSQIGDWFDYRLVVDVVGGNLQIKIDNRESNDLYVNITQIRISNP